MTTVQEPLTGPRVPSFFKSVIHDLTKIVIPSSDESHLFAANVSKQEQLRGVNKAELSSVNKVKRERGISPKPSPQHKVELPGVKKPRTRDKEVELGCGAPALPELEALCGDLTTATNINRAVAQVFLLLAQGRISRRDALAFGSLARLLLRTVPAIRSEFVSAFGYSAWEANLKPKLTMRPASSSRPPAKVDQPPRKGAPLAAKVYQQDELSPPNKDAIFAGNKVELSPVNRVNVSDGPLRSPALCHPAAPSEMPGKQHQGTPPAIPAKIPDARAADSVPNSVSVPNKAPSPPASPAVAVPGITGPRLLWVERFQRFIPESAL